MVNVRTDLANRPTELMLVSYIAQYTKLSGNCRTRQSGSGQTTPVYVGVTYSSRRSVVRVGIKRGRVSGLTSSTTPLKQRRVREGDLSDPDLGSPKWFVDVGSPVSWT